jgi:cytochrome c5
MTDRRAQIEQRLAAATPGEWFAEEMTDGWTIANAPSDLRYLLTRLAAAEERAAYVICDRCDNGYLPTGETETGAFGETVEVERVCEACHGLGVQLAPWLATRLQRRLNALKAAEERADRLAEGLKAAHHELTTLHGLQATDGLNAYYGAWENGADANGAWDAFTDSLITIDVKPVLDQIDAALGDGK